MKVSIFVHVKEGSLLSTLTITVRVFMKSFIKVQIFVFNFSAFYLQITVSKALL